MRKARRKHRPDVYADLLACVGPRLVPPFGIVLGTPSEVAELAAALPLEPAQQRDGKLSLSTTDRPTELVCWQMDLFPARRLRVELDELGLAGDIAVAADLWDLPAVQTLIYPVPLGGERALKLDLVEQAYHTLTPGGSVIVLSPYDNDQFFPVALKKVFGKVHAPMDAANTVFWCQRGSERPRRRHELSFHVRWHQASLAFLSRPGTFSYGRFDEGARALVEAAEVREGDVLLDIGCGVGTNGILAARQAGPATRVTFADSNLRALALTEHNARALGLHDFDILASCTLEELPRGHFDVVLANPPYFAVSQVARMFIERGWDCLKTGGRLSLVTRQPNEIAPLLETTFGGMDVENRRGYAIFHARKEPPRRRR